MGEQAVDLEATGAEPQPFSLVTLEEFAAVDWERPLVGGRKVHADDLADLYRTAAGKAEADGDVAASRVYRLLHNLCGIRCRPSDRAQPFAPMLRLTDGRRSADCEDFRGAQTEVLLVVGPLATNPGLRARLCDLAWTNKRSAKHAAGAAQAAYCEVVNGLLDGVFDSHLRQDSALCFEHVDLIERALQVARATSKGNTVADAIRDTALRVYEAARADGGYAVFTRIAGLMIAFQLKDVSAVASEAEAVASRPVPEQQKMAVKGVWQFAAEAWRRAGDRDADRRCALKSVDATLERAREATTAFTASHCLREAIQELRVIPHTRDQRRALERELRERQQAAIGEMPGALMKHDIAEFVRLSTEAHRDLPLPEALLRFGMMTSPEEPAALEARAREHGSQFPLSSLFSTVHHDRDGKVVSVSPAGDVGQNEAEWLRSRVAEACRLTRGLIAQGAIEPVRLQLSEAHDIVERHLWPIVALSPFVPQEQQPIFALGFARFFQGDFMSAAHLLLGQVEPSVRHVLRTAGEDATMIRSNMLQEDRNLSAMLDDLRPQMEAVFGGALTLAIDLVFNQRPPALRHAFAHGQITAAECFSPEVIYACWFIFHLTVTPLVEHWPDKVEPLIRDSL